MIKKEASIKKPAVTPVTGGPKLRSTDDPKSWAGVGYQYHELWAQNQAYVQQQYQQYYAQYYAQVQQQQYYSAMQQQRPEHASTTLDEKQNIPSVKIESSPMRDKTQKQKKKSKKEKKSRGRRRRRSPERSESREPPLRRFDSRDRRRGRSNSRGRRDSRDYSRNRDRFRRDRSYSRDYYRDRRPRSPRRPRDLKGPADEPHFNSSFPPPSDALPPVKSEPVKMEVKKTNLKFSLKAKRPAFIKKAFGDSDSEDDSGGLGIKIKPSSLEPVAVAATPVKSLPKKPPPSPQFLIKRLDPESSDELEKPIIESIEKKNSTDSTDPTTKEPIKCKEEKVDTICWV